MGRTDEGTIAVSPGRIDVHQHLIPPRYRRALEERGLTAGGWPTPDWDPEAAMATTTRSWWPASAC